MSSWISKFTSSKDKSSKIKTVKPPPPLILPKSGEVIIKPNDSPAAELIQVIKFTPSPFTPDSPVIENSGGFEVETPVKKGNKLQKLEASPWTQVDRSGKKQSNRSQVELEEKEVDQAILGVQSVILLIHECGTVIKQRGLSKLGLLRPYRTSENPTEIRSLCLLFLAHIKDSNSQEKEKDQVPRELWSSARRSKLEIFVDSVSKAEVADVSCVLKWGLSHLHYPNSAPFSKSSASNTLTWYTSLQTPSFTTLLKTLPSPSQNILLETIQLMESIVSFTDSNAMTIKRLSLSFGIYIFGLGGKEWKDWEQVKKVWLEAGTILEQIFKSYLAEQPDLPKRLIEVRDEKVTVGRTVEVLVIEILSEGDWELGTQSNDQNTGRAGVGQERVAPLELLTKAFTMDLAEELNEEEIQKWKIVKELGLQVGGIEILEDEMRRVLGVAGLNLPEVTESTVLSNSSLFTETVTPLERRPSYVNRSNSVNSGSYRRYSGRYTGERRVTPDWSTFTLQGFGEGNSFGAAGEFGLVEAEVKRRPSATSRTLKKPSVRERELVVLSNKQPNISRIHKIRVMEIEEEFLDFYLLTLISPALPSFFLTPLNSKLFVTPEVSNLLLSESFVPFATKPSDAGTSQLNLLSPITSILSSKSFSSQTDSVKKRNFISRRVSSLFNRELATKAKLAGAVPIPPLPVNGNTTDLPRPETIVEVKTRDSSPKLPDREELLAQEFTPVVEREDDTEVAAIGAVKSGLIGITAVTGAAVAVASILGNGAEPGVAEVKEKEVKVEEVIQEPIAEDKVPDDVAVVETGVLEETEKLEDKVEEELEEKEIESESVAQKQSFENILVATPLAPPLVVPTVIEQDKENPVIEEIPANIENQEPAVIETPIEPIPEPTPEAKDEPIIAESTSVPVVIESIVQEPAIEKFEPTVEVVEPIIEAEPIIAAAVPDQVEEASPSVPEEPAQATKSPTKAEKGKGKFVEEVVAILPETPPASFENLAEVPEAEKPEPASEWMEDPSPAPTVEHIEPIEEIIPPVLATPVKVKESLQEEPVIVESPIIATPAWTPVKDIVESTPIKSQATPVENNFATPPPMQPKWLSSNPVTPVTPVSPQLSSSGSPNTSASKKFLNKTGLAGFIRKKKPNLSEQQQIIEEKTAKDLKETLKKEKKAQVIKSPKVVSSVRLRVEELEKSKKTEEVLARVNHSSAGSTRSFGKKDRVEDLPLPPLPIASAPLPAIESGDSTPKAIQQSIPLPLEIPNPTLANPESSTMAAKEEGLPVLSEDSAKEEPIQTQNSKIGLGIDEVGSTVSLVSESSAGHSQAHSFATAISGADSQT